MLERMEREQVTVLEGGAFDDAWAGGSIAGSGESGAARIATSVCDGRGVGRRGCVDNGWNAILEVQLWNAWGVTGVWRR